MEMVALVLGYVALAAIAGVLLFIVLGFVWGFAVYCHLIWWCNTWSDSIKWRAIFSPKVIAQTSAEFWWANLKDTSHTYSSTTEGKKYMHWKGPLNCTKV